MYDIVIIGGGPAGLTAALYASRRGLKTQLYTRDIGGQASKTNEIENFPGFDMISGIDLTQKMLAQAKKFGTDIKYEEVIKITPDGSDFMIKTSRNEVKAKTVLLAFGKKPRELSVPGEDRLKGHGVSYCATCDAPFFKDKVVCVVGGGNSALHAALISAKVAKKVYLIHRRSEFRGEDVLVQNILSTQNIEVIYNAEIKSINGDNKVESITLQDDSVVNTDGVIVEVGFIIDRSLVEGLVEMDETNQVVVDNLQTTSVKGIFAAGDLTQTPYKQIVISAAEGAKAALSAFDYIQKNEGKKGIYADWH